MKKFIRGAVVLCMILCLAVTAFAADNSRTYTGEIDMGSVKGPDGQPVDIEVGEPTEHVVFVEDGGTFDFGNGDVVDTDQLSVVFEKDISSDVLPVTITFEVTGAGSNDILHVMHFNGSAWEQVAEGTGDSVTATFTSLSPVAIILESPAEPDPTAPSDPGTNTPTSPKTGEQHVLLAATAIALLAGTVAVVAVKKKEM